MPESPKQMQFSLGASSMPTRNNFQSSEVSDNKGHTLEENRFVSDTLHAQMQE
jgi:hypothetical protein